MSLWLPNQPSSAPESRASGVTIQYGYSDLFGAPRTVERLRELIGRNSLTTTLRVITRIGAHLKHSMNPADPGLQSEVCLAVFGPEAGSDVWKRAISASKARGGEPHVLFNTLQLVTAVKVALLADTGDHIVVGDRAALGEVLLIINDMMWAELMPSTTVQGGLPVAVEWQQMLLANSLFHSGGNQLHDSSRSIEIYLKDRDHLRGDPSYIDLPTRFERVTGLAPQALWAVQLGFQTYWTLQHGKGLDAMPGEMDRKTYFQRFRFSQAEVDSFFSLVAIDADSLRQEMRQRYGLEALRPFDVLPLAKHPVVLVGDAAFGVATELLEDKLTTGLHHTFLDPGKTTGAERDRFLGFMGSVFEDYVQTSLRRIYPRSSGRLIDGPTLKARVLGKSCDGVLLFEDSAVLIECKASRFSLEVRAGENPKQFRRQLEDIYLDAAEQLDSTLRAVLDGTLHGEGVQLASLHSFIPLVIVADDIGMSPVVFREVLDEIKKRGYLDQRAARTMQVMTVGELDDLAEDLMAGQNFQRLLAEKISDPVWEFESFRNYCFKAQPHLAKKRNSFLITVFDEWGEAARAFYRERGRSEEPG